MVVSTSHGGQFSATFLFFFVFCVCVICVCFSTFCDLYTYISLWNRGKNKLAVAQRRIQTLFWRNFPEVMRRKAEVALLQKHGLNDANPDCLIVLVCQGPLNGVTGFLEISRFPCNCLRIHSFFLGPFWSLSTVTWWGPCLLDDVTCLLENTCLQLFVCQGNCQDAVR